MSILPIYLN